MDEIVKQNDLKQNVFSFDLNRDPSTESRLLIGEIDYNLIEKNDLKYFQVAHKAYWLIEVDNILLGDKDIGLCLSKKCAVVLDSGTSGINGPIDGLQKIISNLPVFDCKNIQFDLLPEIKFLFKF